MKFQRFSPLSTASPLRAPQPPARRLLLHNVRLRLAVRAALVRALIAVLGGAEHVHVLLAAAGLGGRPGLLAHHAFARAPDGDAGDARHAEGVVLRRREREELLARAQREAVRSLERGTNTGVHLLD